MRRGAVHPQSKGTPTDRQVEVLAFVAEERRRRGFAPSIREIGAHFGIGVNGTNDHLLALERKGLIERTPNTARSIRLTPRALLWLAGSEAA